MATYSVGNCCCEGPPVSTPCCPGDQPPGLYVTYTSGALAPYGSVRVVYDPALGVWNSPAAVPGPLGPLLANFFCVDAATHLFNTGGGVGGDSITGTNTVFDCGLHTMTSTYTTGTHGGGSLTVTP